MTRQAQPGYNRPEFPVAPGDATVRSGRQAEAGQAGSRAAGPMPSAAPGPRVGRRRAAAARRDERAGLAGVICYSAVLVCVAAGMYLAWHDGARGGGRGGALAGGALLLAAAVRLLLPARMAGLLAPRRRVTDVLTLTVFGTGLLVAGLVLPRLGKREHE